MDPNLNCGLHEDSKLSTYGIDCIDIYNGNKRHLIQVTMPNLIESNARIIVIQVTVMCFSSKTIIVQIEMIWKWCDSSAPGCLPLAGSVKSSIIGHG